MPSGMQLKSEGFASTLYDPQSAFTLKQYCHDAGLSYSDLGVPVPLDTLVKYGLAFQNKLVPAVEAKMVERLDRGADGFVLTLDDGETVYARSVLMAVGLTYFQHIPSALAGLGSEFVTHSGQHHDLRPFKGREVIVVGGGSSAIDLAGLLHENGAAVQLVARGQRLEIHDKMKLPRPLRDRISAPMSGIGPGWRSLVITEAPQFIHALPEQTRLRLVRKSLPPAAGWFMKDRVLGKVPTFLGHTLERAEVQGGRINLHLAERDGGRRQLGADHVIAATGYAADVRRMSFLSERIVSHLKTAGNTPVLSPNFESTVPGLYFAGVVAANSFGPVLRFIVGAKFAAPRIANHLARSYRQRRSFIANPVFGDRQETAHRGSGGVG